MENVQKRVEFRSFAGQVSNTDPHEVPKGAMIAQTNIGCQVPGQLTVRKGMRALSFTNATTAASTARVQTLIWFRRPECKYIVYTDGQGNVKAGRNPS